MNAFQSLVALSALLSVLCIASAIVARQGAYEARAALRRTQNDIHELMLELDRVRAAIRRIEGRQTATFGRTSSVPAEPPDSNRLPDPLKDPEAWRAAVRLLPFTAARRKHDGNSEFGPDELVSRPIPASPQRERPSAEASINGAHIASSTLPLAKARGRPPRANGEGKRGG